ncbi:acyl carrier protein [Kitasatospora brasiliensis]|uniref:acyl carrier protein n=1 Tax=Kitasatospora brasiliensis TaxID=3058040 RepID=UPI00292D84FE|nr:acyl carrier protein [Kitasatospora sp. K002]
MSDVMSTLRPLVARVAQHPADDITADSNFKRFASWGSLAAMRLLANVEQTYHVQLDLRSYMKLETVGQLATEIADRLGTAAAAHAG